MTPHFIVYSYLFIPWISFLQSVNLAIFVWSRSVSSPCRRVVSCYSYSQIGCHLWHMVVPLCSPLTEPFSYLLETSLVPDVSTSGMVGHCYSATLTFPIYPFQMSLIFTSSLWYLILFLLHKPESAYWQFYILLLEVLHVFLYFSTEHHTPRDTQ
jgi:hypothetical protein